tara:strand:+ start:428 stop:850 length:423 start_codon:yes stop_codon:yes gene_type:complete
MKMKISRKRFKEILAEEIKAFKEGKYEIEKMGKNLDKSAGKVGKRKKDLSVKEASGDDYHDDEWVDVLDDLRSYDQSQGNLPEAPPHEALEDKIYDLIDAVEAAGDYDPELTDAYVALLRAMKDSGIRLDRLMMLAENKK